MGGGTPLGLTGTTVPQARTASEPSTCQVLDSYVATPPTEFQSQPFPSERFVGKGPINSIRGVIFGLYGTCPWMPIPTQFATPILPAREVSSRESQGDGGCATAPQCPR